MRFFFAIPSNPRRQNYRLIELINRNQLVIQYFPVRREAVCRGSRTRESLGAFA